MKMFCGVFNTLQSSNKPICLRSLIFSRPKVQELEEFNMGQTLGCIQAEQSKIAITEHFGKFDYVLEPGCHCLLWCAGYQVAGRLSLRVQQLDVKCETKTNVSFHVLVFCESYGSIFATILLFLPQKIKTR